MALIVAAYVGDALTTTWADRHPLLLTLLNARSRVLVLTTNQLDPVSYYVAAGLRLLASDRSSTCSAGGTATPWWSGSRERSETFGEQVRLYERAFTKAAYPLVFLAPNPYICLFAGTSGMPLGSFFSINIVGTVARLYLIRRVGEAFDTPVNRCCGSSTATGSRCSSSAWRWWSS